MLLLSVVLELAGLLLSLLLVLQRLVLLVALAALGEGLLVVANGDIVHGVESRFFFLRDNLGHGGSL